MNKILSQKFKALDKLFEAGFTDEKSILKMQMEDFLKLSQFSTVDINLIIKFKQAIKEKNIVAFLSDNKE